MVPQRQPEERTENLVKSLPIRLPASLDQEGDAALDLFADGSELSLPLLLCQLVRLHSHLVQLLYLASPRPKRVGLDHALVIARQVALGRQDDVVIKILALNSQHISQLVGS